MTIKHVTTKAAGQKLHAVADWNANHVIDEIEMTDDKKIYFDTAKSKYIEYTDDHGELIWGGDYICSIAGIRFATNTGADAGGNWEPELAFFTTGRVLLQNISQGDISNRYFEVKMGSGLHIDTVGHRAQLRADLLTSPRVLQFPNVVGTFITTGNTPDIMVATPATAGAAGVAGQIAYDTSFFYVCVAANTWKRVAISTWP